MMNMFECPAVTSGPPQGRRANRNISYFQRPDLRKVNRDTDSSDFKIRECCEGITKIKSIEKEDFRLSLKNPIKAHFTRHKNGFSLENEELNIVAFGKTRTEARKSFYDYFHFLYETFYEEEDEKLGEQALGIKKRIEDLVE